MKASRCGGVGDGESVEARRLAKGYTVMLHNASPGSEFRFVQIGGGTENFTALTGANRHSRLPDLLTMKELGYDVEFCVSSWWFAPKGTPAEAVDGMAAALEKASGTSRIKEFYEKKLFADTFLKGDPLSKSLDETWKRILPVALQARKK